MSEYTKLITPYHSDGTLAAVAAPVTAPGPYVQDGDVLILSVTTTDSSGSLNFNGRLLRLDGEIVPWNETLTFSGTGTQTDKITPLVAGFIIGFDVSRASGTLTDGEVNASVHIGRNTGSLQQKLVCLASGEITNIRSLGLYNYTYGLAATSTALPTIVTAGIADPAAGVELTVTVPASTVWELQGFRAIFTTSATVATREVSLQLDDGTNTFYKAVASGTQTASLARGYNFTDSGSSYQSTGGGNFMVGIGRPMIGAGYRLSTSVSNLQATDAWTACFFNYRRHT